MDPRSRSCRSRSEAKRSSGRGQCAASAPRRWASRTRRVDDGRVAEPGQVRAERPRPDPSRSAEDDGRRPLPGQAPCASRAPRRARGRGRSPRSSQAMVAGLVRPATISSARAGRRRWHAPRPRRSSTRVAGRRRPGAPAPPSRTRSSGVSMSTPGASVGAVLDGHPALLGQPARQRVVGGEVGQVRQRRGGRWRWPTMSAEKRLLARARAARRRAAAATNRARSAGWPAARRPTRGPPAPRPGAVRLRARAAAPRTAGRRGARARRGQSRAPAARNPARWRSASAARASRHGPDQRVVARAVGSGCRMMAVTPGRATIRV